MECDLLLEFQKNFEAILLGCKRVTLHQHPEKDELIIKFWDENLYGELHVSGQLIEGVSSMYRFNPNQEQLELNQ